mgnify:CR=1 FL=1
MRMSVVCPSASVHRRRSVFTCDAKCLKAGFQLLTASGHKMVLCSADHAHLFAFPLMRAACGARGASCSGSGYVQNVCS